MAEVLILKRKHFAEDAKPAEWSKVKWNGRPLRGDIISVKPNGFYRVEALGEGTHGWNRDAYCLIRLPKVDEKTIEYLMKSYTNASLTSVETVRHKHQYRIPQWESIPWKKNKVKFGIKEFEEWYIDINKVTDVSITNKASNG